MNVTELVHIVLWVAWVKRAEGSQTPTPLQLHLERLSIVRLSTEVKLVLLLRLAVLLSTLELLLRETLVGLGIKASHQ